MRQPRKAAQWLNKEGEDFEARQLASSTIMVLDHEESAGVITHLGGKLTKELLAQASALTPGQMRGLVDAYYQVQEYRKRAQNQTRAIVDGSDPHPLMKYVYSQLMHIERDIQRMMHRAAEGHKAGQWLLSICGIGPVIAAGLLAHLDVRQAPTPSHFLSFSGMNPMVEWLGTERANQIVSSTFPGRAPITMEGLTAIAEHTGRKVAKIVAWATEEDGTFSKEQLRKQLARRPWNAKLKVLLWKAAESFVKVQNREEAPLYSELYKTRKALEKLRNEQGQYRELAETMLQSRRFRSEGPAFAAYSQGKLPDRHVDMRAKWYVKKIFLCHLHHVMYECEYGKVPPLPYILEHDPVHHTHYIPPYNWRNGEVYNEKHQERALKSN